MRDALKNYCERYAHCVQYGPSSAAQLVLDDLEAYVMAVKTGCAHPGMCSPGSVSQHCGCMCSVCYPR